ncbi:DUF5677 domain-containing protein [Phaeobacter sp. G2]|nr:DUF5677 domain-containing protein [Phaeobacter sp. G2]
MDKMKKVLEAEIEKIPRHFTRLALKRKLEEQGVKDRDAIEAFVDHVLSGKEEAFEWDGGDNVPEKIAIEFTDQDGDEILEKMNDFLNKGLPKLIHGSIEDGAKSIVKDLEKRWPEVKLNEKYETRHFSDRIDLRWSKGLDPLRMMLIASREIGEVFSGKLVKSKAKRGKLRREALMILHARACQTTREILTLIESGFPDGAYARWRTLYEITVVAFFISRFGDEAAKRYIAHDVVSARDLLENEFKFAGEVFDPSSLEGPAKQIEDDYEAVVELFGRSFKGPYGWAADSLGCKAPRFQDLEQAVDWGALPQEYKWSSLKVHAGSAGTLRTLGSILGDKIIHSGATNAGLQTPAIHTASSLLQITSLIFPKSHQLETAVQLKALVILRDNVVKECRKAARKLERDELKNRTVSGQ